MKNSIPAVLTMIVMVAMLAMSTAAFAQGPAKSSTQNAVQVFTPDPQYSAAVDVGTGKIAKTYTIGAGQSAFYVNCYSADRTIPATVNVSLNSATSHKILLGSGTMGPFGVNNTGKGTKTTALTFTGYTTAEAKHITCEVWGQ
jgi:hypothetical protein